MITYPCLKLIHVTVKGVAKVKLLPDYHGRKEKFIYHKEPDETVICQAGTFAPYF